MISLAEEGGNGKGILLKEGAYKDMSVCLMYVLPLPWRLPLRHCRAGATQHQDLWDV